MIQIRRGNVLEAHAEALVNTVNCVGYMGKGIALQFKKAYPSNFEAYQKAAKAGEIQPGQMFIHDRGAMLDVKYIINFPTKRHWRGRARYEDISSGLEVLVKDVGRLGIRSIAIPPLGCGLGGLDWKRIRPMIEKAFEALPNVEVLLYEPAGAPDARTMPIGTARPKLTVARALFIKLMQQYSALQYRLTLLEIHKLAYFMQEAGQPLRLNYQAGFYGPYAPNLNKVLETLEGHFIRGYGDSQKPDVEIQLVDGSSEEADAFLAQAEVERARLERVSRVIEGFETPYGMELLSSVNWLASNGDPIAANPEDAIRGMAAWNDRKQRMFQQAHIRVAWDRLVTESWIRPSSNVPDCKSKDG